MNNIEDIIQRCHERYAERKKLRQRKTILIPALYKRPPFHIQVFCARGTSLMLEALENADISFMPLGHSVENQHVPFDCGGDRFLTRQNERSWRIKQWNDSWGLLIYTGIPSERDGARWHDIVFKYKAICDAPQAVATCVENLLNAHVNPLLTLTRTGGLRFTCRIQDYLHPNTEQDKFHIYTHKNTEDNDTSIDVYLEIIGDKGYSRWDLRYEILFGNLLEPPVIAKEVLFSSINSLRDVLHKPISPKETFPNMTDVNEPTFGSIPLDLAKEVLTKRGYSYLQENQGVYHWIRNEQNGTATAVKLWEEQAVVWIQASTPDSGIPITAVPITDIWDDTGISPTKPVDKMLLSIREGSLSPLAIKRQIPILHKSQTEFECYKSIKEQSSQLQKILDQDRRIIALMTPDVDILNNINQQHTYVMDERKTSIENLFIKCSISRKSIDKWIVNNNGNALGNFAVALLNVLKTQHTPYRNPVGQLRSAVEAFKQHEEQIIQQMCAINELDTHWCQLKRFFAHYTRDADAPIQWNDKYLKFLLPPKLHPDIKQRLLITPSLTEQQLRRIFSDAEMDVIRVKPTAWLPGNSVFQIRTSSQSLIETISYNRHGNINVLSDTGERYFRGIRKDIERDLTIKHAIFTNSNIVNMLSDLSEMPNVCLIECFKAISYKDINIEPAQVLWIVGTPKWKQSDIWQQAQMLYANDEKPLIYDDVIGVNQFTDERIQAVYHQKVSGILTQIVGHFGMNRSTGKKVMLLNSFDVQDITDRPQTFLFDWEDFEIAGGMHNLEKTIRIRQHFESERDSLTAKSSREKVEQVLGCSTRQANRLLYKLRGNMPLVSVSIREQILFMLSAGEEKTTSSLIAAIGKSPQSVGNELKSLVKTGEIVRVRRGVYTLPQYHQEDFKR